MVETTVTRNGQITLTQDIRRHMNIKEGDRLTFNIVGNILIISKKDPSAFDKKHFLPKNFDAVLDAIRSSPDSRFKRLGIIPK